MHESKRAAETRHRKDSPMRKVLFSPEAIADFEDIWLYIAQNIPARADDFFLDKLYAFYNGNLAAFPKLARQELILTGKY